MKLTHLGGCCSHYCNITTMPSACIYVVQLKQSLVGLHDIHNPQTGSGAGAAEEGPLQTVMATSAASQTQDLVEQLKKEEAVLQQRLVEVDAQLQYAEQVWCMHSAWVSASICWLPVCQTSPHSCSSLLIGMSLGIKPKSTWRQQAACRETRNVSLTRYVRCPATIRCVSVGTRAPRTRGSTDARKGAWNTPEAAEGGHRAQQPSSQPAPGGGCCY